MAPIGITIWLRAGNDSVKLGEEMGEWHTFGEALRHGINLAFTWLSR
jgi:hypothetical protein